MSTPPYEPPTLPPRLDTSNTTSPTTPSMREDPAVNTTPPSSLPQYNPPDDLPEIDLEAPCNADVTVTILEPNVTGVKSNHKSGSSWTGVEGVEITLKGGGKSYTATTNSSGIATIKTVFCGAYTIELKQDEFKIENLRSSAFTVNASKRSGRELELKIRRQLITMEMFRLPTMFVEAIREHQGMDRKDPTIPANQDLWGHHWVKMYPSVAASASESANESYGWWPLITGSAPTFYPIQEVQGALNGYLPGVGGFPGGSPTTDPDQDKYFRGDIPPLEEVFFPYVTNGKTAKYYKDTLRSKAKGFSSTVSDKWSWRGDGAGWHCKTFQKYLMRESNVWKRVGIGVGAWGWSTNT